MRAQAALSSAGGGGRPPPLAFSHFLKGEGGCLLRDKRAEAEVLAGGPPFAEVRSPRPIAARRMHRTSGTVQACSVLDLSGS